MNIIEKLEQEELARVSANKTIPAFGPGDTVIVNVNVVEGNRKRVQAYEGVVIGRRNRGLNSSFVRAQGVERRRVERTFQLYSPTIASIEVKRRGDVRRAKLYYLRDRSASRHVFAKSSHTSRPRRKRLRTRRRNKHLDITRGRHGRPFVFQVSPCNVPRAHDECVVRRRRAGPCSTRKRSRTIRRLPIRRSAARQWRPNARDRPR